jgi:hypothetical protein
MMDAVVVVVVLLLVDLVVAAGIKLGGTKQPSPAIAEKPSLTPMAIPLAQWRGASKMTRKATVSCSCQQCGKQWDLDSKVTKAIADEQGAGGRLQRAGLEMEQTGATMTPGASGRRIAAGNELHRANTFLGNLYALAACPRCQSVDVLVTK